MLWRLTTKICWRRHLVILLWHQRYVDDLICSCSDNKDTLTTSSNHLVVTIKIRWGGHLFFWTLNSDVPAYKLREALLCNTSQKLFVGWRIRNNSSPDFHYVFFFNKGNWIQGLLTFGNNLYFSYQGRELVSNYMNKLTAGRVSLTSILQKCLEHRARLHETQSDFKPVWNLKPLWKVVLFTWQFHYGQPSDLKPLSKIVPFTDKIEQNKK